MMIDTGAARSSISSELAAQLHLPQSRSRKITVHGIGGEMKAARPVVAHDFRLGNGFLKDYDLTVINYAGGKKGIPGAPAGLLGIDLLSGFELEFDFPNRMLTLYTPENCSGKFLPWTGPYETIEGQRQFDGQLQIPIRLNKVDINAVIDTGASSSALGIDTADDVGVPESALQLDRKSMSMGASGVPQQAYQHRFDSLTVGETTYRHVPLSVQDEHFGVMQMILGMDFFRRRKLWVSFKTEQIFLQSAPPAQAESGSR
jgi:clan AA aspartic protease (TIGR02281 family)